MSLLWTSDEHPVTGVNGWPVDIKVHNGTLIRCYTQKAKRFCEENLCVDVWDGNAFSVTRNTAIFLTEFFQDHGLIVKIAVP